MHDFFALLGVLGVGAAGMWFFNKKINAIVVAQIKFDIEKKTQEIKDETKSMSDSELDSDIKLRLRDPEKKG